MKKGFTLIELLAVIALLGILSLVVVVAMDKSLIDTKEKAYNRQVDTIKLALEEYRIDHIEEFYKNNTVNLTLKDLKDQGYLEYDLRNPKTEQCITNDLELSIVKNGKKYSYLIGGESDRDMLHDGDSSNCVIVITSNE